MNAPLSLWQGFLHKAKWFPGLAMPPYSVLGISVLLLICSLVNWCSYWLCLLAHIDIVEHLHWAFVEVSVYFSF